MDTATANEFPPAACLPAERAPSVVRKSPTEPGAGGSTTTAMPTPMAAPSAVSSRTGGTRTS